MAFSVWGTAGMLLIKINYLWYHHLCLINVRALLHTDGQVQRRIKHKKMLYQCNCSDKQNITIQKKLFLNDGYKWSLVLKSRLARRMPQGLSLKCFMRLTHWEGSQTIPPFRILPDPRYPSSALFNLIQSGDWCSFLWSISHYFVDFDVCLGLPSCWKIHLWPSFSILEEAIRFWAKMSLYWVKFMLPLTLTRAPEPVEAN